MCKAKLPKGMKCSPNCTFFPNMDCKTWSFDEKGIKRRADGKEFVCGYDGHIIKSWYNDCPQEIDRLEIEREKENLKEE